jgi:hypothetical protein
MVNFRNGKNTEKPASARSGKPKAASNALETKSKTGVFGKIHDQKVNTAARQPRVFTVTTFTLLMGLNRPSSGFPHFAAPGRHLPQRRGPRRRTA